jgi:hypothetical protein
MNQILSAYTIAIETLNNHISKCLPFSELLYIVLYLIKILCGSRDNELFNLILKSRVICSASGNNKKLVLVYLYLRECSIFVLFCMRSQQE